MDPVTRRLALGGLLAAPAVPALAAQTPGGVVPWRVECAGDGKTLECNANQRLARADTKQLLAMVAVRFAPELKAAAMQIVLPLGLNLTEPVAVRVDNGPPERQPIQTCDNIGCVVIMTVPDKFLTASLMPSALSPALLCGNTLVTVRPTISRSICSSDISLIGADPRISPSRSTVTRSAISRTS